MSLDRIYVSTACAARHYPSLPKLLEALDSAGLRRIEFGYCPPLREFEFPSGLADYVDRGLMHNYFPPPAEPFVLNLASQNVTNLERSRRFCAQALFHSAALRAPFYSVHCGFLAEFSANSLGRKLEYHDVASYEVSYQTFCNSLRELLPIAKQHGMQLLVEPNVVARRNLVEGRNQLLMLATPREFSRLLDDFPDPALGILLDLGHLKVTAQTLNFTIEEFLSAVASRVEAFHVHDNDGILDQHRPIQNESWTLDLLREPMFSAKAMVVEAAFPSIEALATHVRWLESEFCTART
jgi:sugar phosphate isomerase/epimerase